MITIILAVIFCIAAIACLGVAGYALSAENKVAFSIGAPLALVFIVIFILVPFSIKTVDTGEVAVVKHMGEAKEVKQSGTHFSFWITNKYVTYDTKVQDVGINTAAYSSDAQTMDVEMTLQYQIDAENVLEIAKEYGTLDTLQNRIQSIAIEKTKSVLSSYKAMDIISDRASMSPRVETEIKNAISAEYHVRIATVVLTNIDFSDAFEKAVEDKMIAEQKQLQAEYENKTNVAKAEADAEAKRKEAEAQVEIAKLNAEAKIIAASADREAMLEVAKAEAEALRLKSVEVARALGFKIVEQTSTAASGETFIEYIISFDGKTSEEIAIITDYLKYAEYLEKWDGKLPDVMTGNDASILIPTTKEGL